MDGGGTPVLATHMLPLWEAIEPLRLFIEAFARTYFGERIAENAGVTVSELLENATKYSNLQSPIELVVTHLHREGVLELRVANRSQPARIRILEREFAKVTSVANSNALEGAVARATRLAAGTSMLGLARLAGHAELTLTVTDDLVTMTARLSRTAVASRTGARRAFERGSTRGT